MLAFSLGSAPQLPDNSQVSPTHYKRGCSTPPSLSCSSSLILFLLSPNSPPPLCPYAHGWPLLSLSLSLNKLYSILCFVCLVPYGGRDISAWPLRGNPFPYTLLCLHQTYPCLFLSFSKTSRCHTQSVVNARSALYLRALFLTLFIGGILRKVLTELSNRP